MPLNAKQRQFLRSILANMRIIAAALISGVVVFLAVVLFVFTGDLPPGRPLHTYIALGAGVFALFFSFIIPALIGGSIKQALIEGKRVELPSQFKADPGVGIVGNLLFLSQTRLIIGYAILEGAAIYNLVAYMLERQQVSLATVGLLLAAMILKFPTQGRLEAFVADELRSIDDLRKLGRRQS